MSTFVADVSAVEAVDVLSTWNAIPWLRVTFLSSSWRGNALVSATSACNAFAAMPHSVLLVRAAAAADGDQECRDAPLDMHIAFQNGLTHFTVENMCAYNIVAEK